MNIGPREYKQASLRIALAEGLPVEMRPMTREIVGVQSKSPHNGHATALMHQTCAEADKWWMTLILHVKPFSDGLTQEQLEKFYSRFGFVKIQDAADDGRPAVLMARSPQPPVITRIH